jgi:hypothetical protein
MSGVQLRRVLITRPSELVPPRNRLSTIELFGRFDTQLECPIIAEAMLSQDDNALEISHSVREGVCRISSDISCGPYYQIGPDSFPVLTEIASYIKVGFSNASQLMPPESVADEVTDGW